MSNELDILRAEIDRLNRQGRYTEMLPALQRAVELTREACGEYSPEYVAVLNELGGLQRNTGYYAEALEIFSTARRIAARVFGLHNPNYATTLNNMAGLYRLMKEYEKARQTFNEALSIYVASVGTTHFLTISAMNNLGLLYQEMGRYADAARYHEACLTMLEEGDPNPLAYATTLNNLATPYKMMQRFDQVEGLLNRALDIYQGEVGYEHPLTAGTLNNLAVLYFETGQTLKAKDCFMQVVVLAGKLYGEESRPYATAVTNLARTCEALGEKDEAHVYYFRAANVLRGLFGEDDPSFQRVVEKL